MFLCSSCHATTPKWVGKCPSCGEWNTLEEMQNISPRGVKSAGKVKESQKIQTHEYEILAPLSSMSSELDSVLGGGITPGSLILLSGEPGIGKSTLALQMSEWYAHS